jgi:hypothetical protein
MKRMMMVAVLVGGVAALAVADKKGKPAASNIKTEDCGAMMKANMVYPAKFAEFMTALADTMDAHVAWIGKSSDKNAQAEATAMKKVVADHRALAAAAKTCVTDMEAASKLAPAPHDMSKMDPKMMEMMMKTTALEKEMGAMMVKHAEESEKHMQEMQKSQQHASL